MVCDCVGAETVSCIMLPLHPIRIYMPHTVPFHLPNEAQHWTRILHRQQSQHWDSGDRQRSHKNFHSEQVHANGTHKHKHAHIQPFETPTAQFASFFVPNSIPCARVLSANKQSVRSCGLCSVQPYFGRFYLVVLHLHHSCNHTFLWSCAYWPRRIRGTDMTGSKSKTHSIAQMNET